jgi:hypothetical protein
MVPSLNLMHVKMLGASLVWLLGNIVEFLGGGGIELILGVP